MSNGNMLPNHVPLLPFMDRLYVARARQNPLAPISILPLELLEKIFSICVTWIYGYPPPTHPLAWIQVCHLWRQASLSSPRLWSRIDLCKSVFATEFLERSRSAPLSITSSSPVKVNIDCLIPHAERLHSIDVTLSPCDMTRFFAGIQMKASVLTELTLQLSPMSPGLFLNIALPTVRRLSLTCVSVLWETCQQLTHLTIRGLDPELSPSQMALHSIFAKSPYLEHIRLESITPADRGPSLLNIAPLIHLKALIISASQPVIASILRAISFSPHTRVQLYTLLTDDLHGLFPNGSFPSEYPPEVSSVRLARHAAYFLTKPTSIWSTSVDSIGFSISSSTVCVMPVLNSIPSLLSPYLITSFEFSAGVLWDTPVFALRRLFSQTPNMHTIRVAFNNPLALLQALTPSEQIPDLLCPRLSVLSLNKPGDAWWKLADDWVQAFFDCVYSRHRSGAPLSLLEIFKACGLTEDTLVDRFMPYLQNGVQVFTA